MNHREEQPLQLLAITLRILDWVMVELVLLIEVLSEVYKNCGRLEDGETFVCNSRDTSIGVDLEEPRRLDLVVNFSDVGIADAHLDKTGNTRLVRSASVEKQHCKRYILVVRGIAVCSLRRIIRKQCFVG